MDVLIQTCFNFRSKNTFQNEGKLQNIQSSLIRLKLASHPRQKSAEF